MARLRFALATTAEVDAGTSTGKTILHLGAPANQRVAIRGFGVAFDGVSSTAGACVVQLVIQSSSGTFNAGTLVKDVRGTTEAIQSTGSFSSTAQPTNSDILRSYNIHPMTGYERAFAVEEEIELSGGTRIGLFLIPTSSGPNCHAFLLAEE